MSENTKIEWCDHSWSPWRGCTKVSPGCANCYAETLSKRNPALLGQWGKGKPRVKAKNWGDPVKWNRRQEYCPTLGLEDDCVCVRPRSRVFPSRCDWLDAEVPIDWLADFLRLVYDTPHLDWLLLTKRPENWPLVRMALTHGLACMGESAATSGFFDWLNKWVEGTPPENVWVGTSVEDQQRADERIPELLKIPAKVRFLSVEPLLGPINLEMALEEFQPLNPDLSRKPAPINWVIIGGESGHGTSPCNVEWVRSVVKQCQAASVPCFVKQLGANSRRPCGCKSVEDRGRCPDCFDGTQPLTLKHPKGGDPVEWPSDLRVRQFPEPTP